MAKAKSKLGSFRELPDGRIKVAVAHGYNLNGSPRRLYGVADTMEEAQRMAIDFALQLGVNPDLGRGLTLARWWEAYKLGKGQRVAGATLDRYDGDMRRIWLPALGRRDISLITRQEVQSVLIGLQTRSQAVHAKRTISAVLTQAVRDGYLAENPIKAAAFELPGDVGAELDFEVGGDPFAAIEGRSDVWDARTVLAAMGRLRGAPIEGCWLAMVGAGLRLEEAMALLWRDIRRIEIDGSPVVQIAVYKAYTARDGLKRTKTKRSVRIVAVVEPFGSRLWEMRGEPDAPLVPLSPSNVRHRWRGLFEPVTSKHAPKSGVWKGTLAGLPYVALNRMRATHETFMQQAGVLDSVNAAAHGHSVKVSYEHYQRADSIDAAKQAGRFLVMEGGIEATA